MSKIAGVTKGVNRARRNLFKAGTTLGAVGLAFLFSSASRKASAAAAGPCFLKGTRITTVGGEQAVEDLAVGSRLPTMFGGDQPIESITRQVFRKSNGTQHWRKSQMLVKIARSALANDVPHSDLFVTSGHAIHVDGVLVPAGYIVNGTTVTWFAPECDEFEVYHFKLENHDVIRAQGALCETLRLTGEPCLPLVGYFGGRSEIKSRLRSALSPWIDRRENLDIFRDHIEERGIFQARPFSG